jgi:hypothetical protein
VAADNYAHTYAILSILERRLSTSSILPAIIEKTESEEHKALYQEAERLLMMTVISKSEEHFELTAMRWAC